MGPIKLEKHTTLENEKDNITMFSELFENPSLKALLRDRRRVEIKTVLYTEPNNPASTWNIPRLVSTFINGAGPIKRYTTVDRILAIKVKMTGYCILSAI